MLVFSRRKEESFMIGDDIEIMICDVRNNGTVVRLGITAPTGGQVYRKEVYDLIQQELNPINNTGQAKGTKDGRKHNTKTTNGR